MIAFTVAALLRRLYWTIVLCWIEVQLIVIDVRLAWREQRIKELERKARRKL